MAIMPDRTQDAVQWCETHVNVWSVSPSTVGLTAGQISLLLNATTDSRAALSAADAARQASKAATTSLNANVSAMRTIAGDLIRQIKAYAELQANPEGVYTAAQIPPPAAPEPLPAPGRPKNFQVALESDGSITLSWDCENASASSGVFFSVMRKLPGQSAFVPLGGCPGTTAERRRPSFTDSTVPATAASAGAQYIVTGSRGTRSGEPSDAVVVQFGADGTTTTIVDAELGLAA